jgi:AraC family transcriptional regulator
MPDPNIIVEAIDFIEENLQKPIMVADMAESVSYSVFHFCRVFNQVTHLTPFDYLIRRRLSDAIHPLQFSKRRILEISLDYQFGNPETFSRAFRRMFGVLPSELRKGALLDRRHIMPRWTSSHLVHIHKCAPFFHKIEERESFQVAGLMTLVQQDLSVIPELWNYLFHEIGNSTDFTSTSDCVGITFYPLKNERQSTFYMASVRHPGTEKAGGGLVTKQIPAMKAASFNHRGTLIEQALTLDYAYHAWLPRSGKRLSIPWVIENFKKDVWRAGDVERESLLYIPLL